MATDPVSEAELSNIADELDPPDVAPSPSSPPGTMPEPEPALVPPPASPPPPAAAQPYVAPAPAADEENPTDAVATKAAKSHILGTDNDADVIMGTISEMELAKSATVPGYPSDSILKMETMMLGQTSNDRVMRSGEELLRAAARKLKTGANGQATFWVMAIALGFLNVYSIILRWYERPWNDGCLVCAREPGNERDPDADYNLSTIVLAWSEFLVIAVLGARTLYYAVSCLPCFSFGRRAYGLMQLADYINLLTGFSMFKILGAVKFSISSYLLPALDNYKATGEKWTVLKLRYLATLLFMFCIVMPIMLCSPLAVLIKLSQVAFVGKPPAEWTCESRMTRATTHTPRW